MIEFITEFCEWIKSLPPSKINLGLIVLLFLTNLLDTWSDSGERAQLSEDKDRIKNLEWEVRRLKRNMMHYGQYH
jgi:hypothetical protein